MTIRRETSAGHYSSLFIAVVCSDYCCPFNLFGAACRLISGINLSGLVGEPGHADQMRGFLPGIRGSWSAIFACLAIENPATRAGLPA